MSPAGRDRRERFARSPASRGGTPSGGPQRDRRQPNDSDRASFDETRGVFMISVAAELAEMHPQTLRMYEARGLITPQRSPKNTRLYSYEDVERLRRIQEMTQEGLNLTGVEAVLELEEQIGRMRSEIGRMRKRAAEMERKMLEEVERVRKSFRAELVPYGAYEPDEITPRRGKRVKIPVERRRDGPDGSGDRTGDDAA